MKSAYILSFALIVTACSNEQMVSYAATNGNTGLLTRFLDSDGSVSKARRAKQAATCESYGFKPETEAFANCIMQEDQSRKARAKLDEIESKKISQQYMDDYNPNSMFPPTVRCNSSQMGKDVVTECR